MYRRYPDLREKLGEPLWHDDQGVPRYAPFAPDLCGVYDRFVALLEIDCQGCGRRFLVASATQAKPRLGLPTATEEGDFWFGDAPHHANEHGTCVGVTMTTGVCRVVEFWTRDGGDHGFDWRRRPEHEFTYQ
jgi:hypothetical protein